MKKYFILVIVCISITGWFSCNNFVDNTDNLANVKTLALNFKSPGPEYGPSILWGWEGPLNKETIIHDLDVMKALNVFSVDIEAGYDMEYPYLSEGYFDLIKFAVEQAKKRGMVIWMIDEGKYPSGFAGGKFSRERPDLCMQGLDTYKRVKLTKGENISMDLPLEVISAMATNLDNNNRQIVDISSHKLDWTAPEGNWEILLCYHRFRTSVTRAASNPTHGKDTVNSLFDYLNPTGTRQFLEFTHEQYKKVVGDEFGKTFQGFRGDEPDYGFTPWSPEVPKVFKDKKGYDVRPYMAAFLVRNLQNEELLKIKADYWDVWSDMFGENFFKVQADWCAVNDLKYMVHLNHEDKMMDLARSEGDFFENLRHVQIPGVDAIWNQIWPGKISDFPKYASSVSHAYGKKRALSESFAAYRPRPTLAQAKWVVDYQLARGINFFEFMYWGSSASRMKNPSGWMADSGFPRFMKYANRMNYLLSEGRPVAHIAVYYPTSSLWLGNKNSDEGTFKIMQQLLENQYDFDFVDEHSINDVLELSENGFKNKSGQVYNCVIVPPLKAISKTMLNRLETFSSGGGKVIFMGELPSLLVEKDFKDAKNFEAPGWLLYEASDSITEQVKQNLPEPDLWLEQKNPAIKYNHRKFKNADLFFVFNEAEENVNSKINVRSSGTVQEWNAYDAKISNINSTRISGNQTRFDLNLQPWETKVFIVEK